MAMLVSRMARGVIGCTIGAVRMIGSTLANATIGSATRGAASSSSAEFSNATAADGDTLPPQLPRVPGISGVASWFGGTGGAALGAQGNGSLSEEELLFTKVTDPLKLDENDINRYYTMSEEIRAKHFAEGLPGGLGREFETTKTGNILVRKNILELLRRINASIQDRQQRSPTPLTSVEGAATELLKEPPQTSFLLDGPTGSGKSIALAFAVHWARSAGWLTMYIPSARQWTSGEFIYRHAHSSLWDTPWQAKEVLQGLMSSHADILEKLPTRVKKPLELGDSPAMGPPKTPFITLPDDATLKDLVGQGISQIHAAVSVVLRVHEELRLVTEVPVMIAIDEYNAWLSVSGYNELKGTHGGHRRIHSKELRMVDAYRRLDSRQLANGVVLAAFSHSIPVADFPMRHLGMPCGVHFHFPRYTEKETATVLNYYFSQGIGHTKPATESIKWMHFLTNGNGEEMRTLASVS